tara:strand:+ start:84 stop:230 length:147 start_codon:yes stop_codon:yes gene_type:complete
MENERVEREKKVYDETDIFESSHNLQMRFEHVFLSPNTMAGKTFLSIG